jgi:2-dehydropantoate 2-reductase
MRICIYGAGAIGGYIGALLTTQDLDVTLVARGPHLAAMQANGLRLLIDGAEHVVHPRLTDNPVEAGIQDYIIVTVKSPSMKSIVEPMQHLLGPETSVITAVNGIPWWYFYRHGGDWENHRLATVDPGDVLWNGIGPERVIGCVVYPATEVIRPGVIKHIEGNRLTLGEPSGEKTERVLALSKILMDAGLKAPVRRIRDEIWLKLWGNLSFNPISALTLATLDVVATDPETRALAKAMMIEAQQVGEKLGVRFLLKVEQRLDGAAAVGAHRTSMLQDLEAGRPMEVDALVASVQELGRLVEVATPTIDIVLALVRQRARSAGTYD